MTIREVTYYQAACDEPGCPVDTDWFNNDYSAWGNKDAAADQWRDHDGLVIDDGRCFCEEHRAGHECDWCDWTGDGATRNEDADWLCPTCYGTETTP